MENKLKHLTEKLEIQSKTIITQRFRIEELTEKLDKKIIECNNWSKMHGEILDLSVNQKTTIDELREDLKSLEKENRHLAYQAATYLDEMRKMKSDETPNFKEDA